MELGIEAGLRALRRAQADLESIVGQAYATGRADLALDAALAARRVTRHLAPPRSLARLGSLADVAVATKDALGPSRALWIETALMTRLERDHPRSELLFRTYVNGAQTCSLLGRSADALSLSTRAMKLGPDVEIDAARREWAREFHATQLHAEGEVQDAEALFRQVIEGPLAPAADEIPDPVWVRAGVNLASLLVTAHRFAEAREVVPDIARWVGTLAAGDRTRDVADGLVATLFDEEGRYEEALPLKERILERALSTRSADLGELLRLEQNVITSLILLGSNEVALDRIAGALAAAVDNGYAGPVVAHLRRTRAIALQRVGLLDEAASEVQALLDVEMRPRERLAVRAIMASVESQRGRSVEASAEVNAVLRELEESADEGSAQLLAIQTDLAAALYRIGDRDGAEHLSRRVLDVRLARLDPTHPEVASARTNLAVVLKDQGDFTGALALEQRAFDDLVAAGRPEDRRLLRARLNLAGTLVVAGRSEEARTMLEAVLRSVPEGAEEERIARVAMAALDWEQQRGDRGASAAGAVADELVRTGRLDDPLRTKARIRQALGLTATGQDARPVCLRLAGETVAWIERAGIRMSLREAESAARSQEPVVNLLGSLIADGAPLAGEGELVQAMWDVVDAGRSSLRRVRARRDASSLAPEERERAVAAIDALDRRIAAARELAGPELTRLLVERDQIERQLVAATLGATPPASSPVPPEGCAVVSFVQFFRVDPVTPGAPASEWLLAFVRTAAGATCVDLGDAREIERLASRWIEAVRTESIVDEAQPRDAEGRTPFEVQWGSWLRAALIDPLRRVAPAADRWVVVADGVATRVPLDALPLDDGVLGDVLAVTLAPSAPTDAVSDSTELVALLTVGAIDYGEVDAPSFPALVESGAELDTIEELHSRRFPGGRRVRLDGSAATPEALRAELAKADGLHVATHAHAPRAGRKVSPLRRRGVWIADPMLQLVPLARTGLALSGANLGGGGWISGEELARLDLGHVRLAVLSACVTGSGRARAITGVESIAKALHAAGVGHVVSSLVRAGDVASREMMAAFYRSLWDPTSGLSPIESALWRAKCELRERGRRTSDWAFWVVSRLP